METDPLLDVLIIGAGAAGLAAAGVLVRAGRKFRIIEARNRIGGRVFTEKSRTTSMPTELGAEFIHGEVPESFALAKGLPLPIYESLDSHRVCRGGKIIEDEDFWERVGAVFRGIKSEPEADQSFAEFLKSREMGWDEKAAVRFVEGFHAADISKMSAQALREMEIQSEASGGEKAYRIPSGYDVLLNGLIRDIPEFSRHLVLDTIAKEFHWSNSRVETHTVAHEGGSRVQFHSKKVLLTLPLGVLKSAESSEAAVKFYPEIPEKLACLEFLEMGEAIKLVFEFRSEFWRKQISNLGFIHEMESTEVVFPTWWSSLPVQTPALSGWVGGPRARVLRGASQETIRKLGLESLAKVLRLPIAEVESEFVSLRFHDWGQDPFSQGAYSYVGVQGLTAQRKLAEPYRNVLFFAGEATHFEGQAGTVEGAIATGKRAAREILDSLR